MRIRAIVTLVAILAVGSALAPGQAQAAFPGANGRIVFVSYPDGSSDSSIATMEADGSGVQVLISATWPDRVADPEWSPGGTMIVFSRTLQKNSDIWRMNADGSGLLRLTRHPGVDASPAWSADGALIAFGSDRSDGYELYSMRIDGTGLRRLTTRPEAVGEPVWSPDNDRIAFVSVFEDRSYSWAINTMRPDGGDMRQVVAQEVDEDDRALDPDWSPDGTRIAWGRPDYPHHGGSFEVVVATGVRRTLDESDLAHSSDGVGYAPDATSPVPDAIVFSYITGDSRDIGVRSSAPGATESVRLTSTPDREFAPDWQPIPEFPLVDARFSSFETDIEWVYAEGITVGCSAERYCPADPVTREQMAIFLDRTLDLPPSATDYFSDDTGRTGEASINRLRAAGITTGCALGKYCPTDTVSRAQMASFLARAFSLPAATTDYFRDDDGTTHEPNINRIAAAAITTGCAATRYCPTADVTRGQMAAFLFRGLDATD